MWNHAKVCFGGKDNKKFKCRLYLICIIIKNCPCSDILPARLGLDRYCVLGSVPTGFPFGNIVGYLEHDSYGPVIVLITNYHVVQSQSERDSGDRY